MSSDEKTLTKRREWALNQEAFDSLLLWLDGERENAGRLYEDIRRRLIKLFVCRGCAAPEELADETINRVAKRVDEIAQTYVGDPALYFCGVANKVHLETLRRRPPVVPPPVPERSEESERELICLEKCIEILSSTNRNLVIQYYQEEKQARIKQRQRLAEQLGIPLNALRIRAHRIRAVLKDCVRQCLLGQEP